MYYHYGANQNLLTKLTPSRIKKLWLSLYGKPLHRTVSASGNSATTETAGGFFSLPDQALHTAQFSLFGFSRIDEILLDPHGHPLFAEFGIARICDGRNRAVGRNRHHLWTEIPQVAWFQVCRISLAHPVKRNEIGSSRFAARFGAGVG
jgi:hypothetical protein